MELLALAAHPIWFLISVLLAIILRTKRSGSWSPRQCQANLTGKTAIVTGANTGIGKAVALDLARRNAKVIMACRSRERGQAALQEILEQTGNKNVTLSLLDTSSMSSVRSFAERVLQEEKRLDILVNNAGASGLPQSITSEGFELTFATNHLGPFLLTNLLLAFTNQHTQQEDCDRADKLLQQTRKEEVKKKGLLATFMDLMKSSNPSRIVFVSSVMHKKGVINIKNLRGEEISSFHVSENYSCTKLMNLVCANELARRLQETGVTVNSLHPGIVMTEAMRNYGFIMRFLFQLIGFFFFKSAEDGAASTIFCAVSDEMEGVTGKYIDSDCTLAVPSDKACDVAVAKKLWEACETATRLHSTT